MTFEKLLRRFVERDVNSFNFGSLIDLPRIMHDVFYHIFQHRVPREDWIEFGGFERALKERERG